MSLKHVPSVKGRWSEALTNSQVQEREKLEAVKASNLKGYNSPGENIVDSMTKTFDNVYIQKRESDVVDSRISQGTLIVIQKTDTIHTIEAGTAYSVDVTDSGNCDALREALLSSEEKEISMQVGISGSKSNEPRIDVTALAQLRDDGSIVLGFLIDVHKEFEMDPDVYGRYRIDQYLPVSTAVSQISPSRRPSFTASLILQMRIALIPNGGWTFFNKRKEDPTYTIEKRRSRLAGFQIRPVSSVAIDSSKSSDHTFTPPLSPCDSEPTVSVEEGVNIFTNGKVGQRCRATLTSSEEDEDLAKISLEDAQPSPVRDPSFMSSPGGSQGDGGYVMVEAAGEVDDSQLDIAYDITPCLLYHQCHRHRMIPTVMLHPDTNLLSRSCLVCKWTEMVNGSPEHTASVPGMERDGKTLEFVCPDCALFVCSECAYQGDGVIGSMETRQVVLNSEVLFEGGYSTLLEDSYGLLEQLGRLLLDNPIPIRIEGHINTVKSSGKVLPASSPLIKVYEEGCDGQMLSERRAKMVSMYLEAMGVDSKLLTPVGCGGERPITRVKADLNQNRYFCNNQE
jgi:outer membrane protein OmpA-like peptidoglycan-associated protein